MEIAYWIVASLLSLLFAYAGGRKVAQDKERLAPLMNWVDTIPMWLVRTIGVLELLGVVGLLLPPLTGISPGIAAVAAAGFVVSQILATALHLSRGEVRETGLNITLIALAGVAMWLAIDLWIR